MSIDEIEKGTDTKGEANELPTGESNEMENKQATPDLPPEASEQEKSRLPAPFVGFDGDGFFVFRIHPAFGYHAIQGHLAEAGQWLRQVTVQQQRKEMMEKEAKKLMRPTKGLKLF